MEQFPEGLREALARADEDYLMGLSNKGTVNRGKKDLQGYSPLVRIGQRLYLSFQGNLPPPDHGHPVGQGAGGGPEYGGREPECRGGGPECGDGGIREGGEAGFLAPPGLPR